MAIEKQDFDRLLTDAMMQLPGASNAGIKLELFSTMSEFFADSLAWTEVLIVPVTPPTQTYSLTPSEGQIIQLVGAWDQNNLPVAGFMPDFGILQLTHQPSSSLLPNTAWSVKVIKNVQLPTTRDDAPIAPDWSLKVYYAHILDGLVGRMMNQINKSYSNPTMATYHLKRFRQGIQLAAVQAQRMNTNGAQAWAYPRNFRSNGQQGGNSTAWPPGGGPIQ